MQIRIGDAVLIDFVLDPTLAPNEWRLVPRAISEQPSMPPVGLSGPITTFSSGRWCEAVGFKGPYGRFGMPPARQEWLRLRYIPHPLSGEDDMYWRLGIESEPISISKDEFWHLASLAIANGHSWTVVNGAD